MTNRVPSDETPLHRFGFGCVKLGSTASPGGPRAAERLVKEAVAGGVTFFDTADAYGSGNSEAIIGRALGRDRDRVTIATKGGYLFSERSATQRSLRLVAGPIVRTLRSRGVHPTVGGGGGGGYQAQDFSASYLRTAIDGSLRRLQTDHIDLYQLHGPPSLCPPETIDLMREMIAAGKIRSFGVGLERVSDADDWLPVEPLSSIQVPFGVFDPEARRTLFPRADRAGVQVIVRGVLGSGLLSEMDGKGPTPAMVAAIRRVAADAGVAPHQIAIWFALAHAEAATILVGVNSIDHLQSTVRWLTTANTDPSILERVDEIIERHRTGDLG